MSTHLHRLMNSSAIVRAPEGLGTGGGPAGANSAVVNTTTNDPGPTGGGIENNSGNKPDILAGFWDDEEEKPDGSTPQLQTQQQQQQQQQSDPQEAVQAHLREIGLGDLELTPEEEAQLATGAGSKALFERVLKASQTAYLKAMGNMQNLVTKQVNDAVEKAQQNTNTTLATDKFKSKLEEALPFTKDPLTNPVALTVAKRLLGKGKSEAETIEGVREYFKRLQQQTADLVTPDTNFNSNYNKSRPGADTDWVKLLTDS